VWQVQSGGTEKCVEDSGTLPHYKIGKVVWFKVSDIHERLETKWEVGLKRSRF
jgi:hypothetical protein